MNRLAGALVLVVAIVHLGFLVLEMFLWDHPVGREVFAMTPEQSAFSSVLAANQGLYNGFLAAGLLWGLVAKKRDVQIFFLLCVVVAGLFGGLTAKATILFTQALPGALALALVLASQPRPRETG
jgi:putative membrane protein